MGSSGSGNFRGKTYIDNIHQLLLSHKVINEFYLFRCVPDKTYHISSILKEFKRLRFQHRGQRVARKMIVNYIL